MQLALNDISPSHHTLGALNGIGLTLGSAAQAVMPPLITSLYAYGVNHQILHGQLAWVVMIALSWTLIPMMCLFPKKAYGLRKEDVHG